MINHVVIDPGHGHVPGHGFQRGHSAGWISESDIIDLYIPAIVEELELERLRYKVLKTRTHPGLSLEEKKKEIEPGSLVLSCHVGVRGKEPVNGSRVLYGNSESKELAQLLSRTCHQWGKSIHWLHANLGSVKSPGPILDLPETHAVEIEPFLIDFPEIRAYTERLSQLGRLIGRVIADYVKCVNPGTTVKFHQAMMKHPMPLG